MKALTSTASPSPALPRPRPQTYPIHLAACSLSLPVLETLLSSGAFVNQTDADMWSTLHFAALTGWADGIRMLLEYKADPNAVTAHGSTPLQVQPDVLTAHMGRGGRPEKGDGVA